jgi:4'-phosphopantetheinyl transferase
MIGSGQPAQTWLPSTGESRLPKEEVHVWQVDVKSLAGRVHQLTDLLSDQERSRASAFVHALDRERFLVSHAILRILIGGYLNMAPAKLKFAEIARRKPCLEGASADSNLQFNLSHSHGYVLLAFTHQRQVGVDIEHMRPLPDLEQVAARTFSAQENLHLAKLTQHEKLAAFYRCWTRKEAFVKALGSGLYYPLESFSVSIAPECSNCLLDVEDNPAEIVRWKILGLEIIPGYAAALAVDGNDWKPVFWQYSP